MQFQRIRGTRDILPNESAAWQSVEEQCRSQFETYGYSKIRTPAMESSELFTRGLGEGSDLVRKEMYVFQDKGGREIALRPEGTAPVIRAILENGLLQSGGGLLKLYYLGPMYRYDRPQAGRYREFFQAGVEAIGSENPILDVEVISLAVDIVSRLHAPNVRVALNSIGDQTCRPAYLEKLKAFFEKHKDQLCADCKVRLEKNVLRILDCKEGGCQKISESVPPAVNSLCTECRSHFDQVVRLLEKSGISFQLEPRLVRGLDYYTRTTFEVIAESVGAQNAVCGGGRYDNLVEQLGGNPTPAIGFAIGLDRLISLLPNGAAMSQTGLDTYLIPLGDDAASTSFSLLSSLRSKGIRADMDYQNRSLKSALKSADRLKARFVIILGEEELRKNEVILRNMEKGEQTSMPISQVVERIQR